QLNKTGAWHKRGKDVRGQMSDVRYPMSKRLAAREPGVFLPERLKERVVAAENISLGSAQVRDAGRKRIARPQSAFAVTGVLPQIPMPPRRSIARLVVVIGDPEPAIGKDRAMRGRNAAAIQHL